VYLGTFSSKKRILEFYKSVHKITYTIKYF